MKIPQSKRLRSAWILFGIDTMLFVLGIFKGANLSELGTGLALVDTPLLVYILGESIRPSKDVIKQD